MKEKCFVSSFFENTIDKYQELVKNNSLMDSKDFDILIFRILVIIYGELDFLNPRITNDEKSVYRNMTKYGYSENSVLDFFDKFNKYNFMIGNNNVDKNNLAINIQTKLIDMFFLKKNVMNLKEDEIIKFYDCLKILNFEDAIDYFRDKLNSIKNVTNEIEYLEVEPEFINKVIIEKQNKRKFNFGYASGFASIIVILSVIAIVCLGVVIINLVVG